MAKKLVYGLIVLLLCFIVSGTFSRPVTAENQKIAVTTDKANAKVLVTISDSALEGKEVSVRCYNPQWDGTYTDQSNNANIAYVTQITVKGTTSFSFMLNSQVLSGNYSLVTGSANGKKVTSFNFDTASGGTLSNATAAPGTSSKQLAAPISVKAVQSSPSHVKVSWAGVTGTVSYSVYRSAKATTGFVKLADVTATSYVDKKVLAGKTYYYKVTANGKTAAESSVQSSAAKVKLIKAPVVKVKSSKKKITVSWKKISGVKGYKVYVSNKKHGKYKVRLTVKGASKLKGTIKKLQSGKTYFIKVSAYKKSGSKIINGGFSAVKSIKVK